MLNSSDAALDWLGVMAFMMPQVLSRRKIIFQPTQLVKLLLVLLLRISLLIFFKESLEGFLQIQPGAISAAALLEPNDDQE